LAKMHGSGLVGWLSSKIAGQSGFETKFWMNHIDHRAVQQALYEGAVLKSIDTRGGPTALNMVQNYGTIATALERELKDRHCFETFVFYFLHRLVLINLSVEQTDVSMVFEVINDRGVRLRPYEILKGKLLGQIDKVELDAGNYNGLWEGKARAINSIEEDRLDGFFRHYLKAKFAASRKDGQRFDGDYHRAMFAPDFDERLGLLHSPARVKDFLKGPFDYYTRLYMKLLIGYFADEPRVKGLHYNRLLDLDAPFHLVVSACVLRDPDEQDKIQRVAMEIDRYFALLQLQGAYDSNEFADSLFRISDALRDRQADTFRQAFDAELTAQIAARRNVDTAEPLTYAAFRQTGSNLNLTFKRYFFGRIDQFLADNMNLRPKRALSDLVSKTGAKSGFHIEHILSMNDENKALFDGDEERFEQERNRLGGILLLKGKDNISSNNENYADKLRSYANTLYWNETLREDSYKSKLDMDALKKKWQLDELGPLDRFGPEELEARHRLLFRLVGIIWA